MLKKVCAMILAGAMTIAGCINVFAADDAAAESEKANEIAALLNSLGGDASLDDILNAIGGEEGLGELANSLGGEEGLSGLLNSLSEAGGDLSGLLGGLGLGDLAGQLTGEDGSFDLGALAQGLGLGDLSQEDLAGLAGMLENPEALKEMLTGLFSKDGLGTSILDLLGSDDNAIGSVVKSLKGEDGTYDVDKIMESIGNVVEKDHSIVINGTEISEEDIQSAVEKVMGFFMSNEEMENTAA